MAPPRRTLLRAISLLLALVALALLVPTAGSAPSPPPRDLVIDVYQRLRTLGVKDLDVPEGEVSYEQVQGQIGRFVDEIDRDGRVVGGLVDPFTGKPWTLARLLTVTGGDDVWRSKFVGGAAREKQIRAALDGLVWRLGAAKGTGYTNGGVSAALSREAQADTTEKCNPGPPAWTSTPGMRGQFVALLPQALNASSTRVLVGSSGVGVGASGPPVGDKVEVNVSRVALRLDLPAQPVLPRAPVVEARLLVGTDNASPTVGNPPLIATLDRVAGSWLPSADDWALAGTSLGMLHPATIDASERAGFGQRATYPVPVGAVLADGSAIRPRFWTSVVAHFATEEPPKTVWPPTTMSEFMCSWHYSRFVTFGQLVYRQALRRLSAPPPPPDPPKPPDAAQEAANAKLKKAKEEAAAYFQKSFGLAEKGLVGAAGESLIGTGHGGKDAEKGVKLIPLAGDKKAVKVFGKKGVKVASKVAALFSIVTDVAETYLYVTSYMAFEKAQDPPTYDFARVAQPGFARGPVVAAASQLPRRVRANADELTRAGQDAVAYFTAYLTSFQRLQGATRSGDADAQAAQAAAATEYAFLFSNALVEGAKARARLIKSALKAAHYRLELRPIVLRKALKRLRRRGVTRAVLPLERLGFSRKRANAARRKLETRLRGRVRLTRVVFPDVLLAAREPALAATIRRIAEDPEAFAQPPR